MGKCQSNDFDAQIAETTLTLIRHILLTIQHRVDWNESKIELFKQMQQEVQAARLNQRLWGLLLEILNIIEGLFEIDALKLMERLMKEEKACQKINTLFDVVTFKPTPNAE